jgi:predicted nucleotidyltransferase
MTAYKSPIGIHKKLNPVLWENKKLRPEVKKALLRIAREFYRFLKVKTPVKDILVIGSQANYNYSEFSDLDLHLVFDFKSVSCDEPIEELFDTKRKLWREKHDIDIFGINVETYTEDSNNPSISSAYSILTDTWIRDPEKPISTYNVEKVKQLTKLWSNLINSVINSESLSLCKKIQTLLGKYRKLGLKKYGEFGPQNLAYKSLRNMGLIEKLSEKVIDLEDDLLSLDTNDIIV